MSLEFVIWLFAFLLQAGMLGRTMYAVSPNVRIHFVSARKLAQLNI